MKPILVYHAVPQDLGEGFTGGIYTCIVLICWVEKCSSNIAWLIFLLDLNTSIVFCVYEVFQGF